MIPLVDIVGDWDKFLFSILSEVTVVRNLNDINLMYNHVGLNSSNLVIYPKQVDVFKAFKECPIGKLSVVIILQDPYSDGSATGIALANELSSKPLSPSLRVVKDNISRTIYKGEEFSFDPTLLSWAKQGVLLLNTPLTVEKDKPLSHRYLWSRFTELFIQKLSDINSGIIYCLWGKYAEFYAKYINPVSNTILTATHPVYAAYSGTVWDCDHFVKINKQLKEFNNLTITW